MGSVEAKWVGWLAAATMIPSFPQLVLEPLPIDGGGGPSGWCDRDKLPTGE